MRQEDRAVSIATRGPQGASLSENQRGMGLVLLGMLAFSFGDVFMKAVGEQLPLGQSVLVRGVIASVIILVLVQTREGLPPARRLASPRLLLRSVFEVGATICFLSAIVRMPIASATAILQAIPLTVTFFGSIFLGEKVGWRRYLAIMAGFAGVLIIVRPTTQGLDAGAMFAIATVFCATGRDLATRRMPADITSLQVVLVTTVLVTAMGFVWMLAEGSAPMTGAQAGMLALAALALPVGLVCTTAAMRIGELAVITPFRYSIFVWALLFGYFVFGEVPDALTFLGTAIIFASGLYTFMREAKLQKDIAARSGKRGAAI